VIVPLQKRSIQKMKICIAQTKALKGNVQKNIQNHLQIIEGAITLNADLIIFPELSITGYEPGLAKILSTSLEDDLFRPFQKSANKSGITIGVGMPTHAVDGINISMLIFQPNKAPIEYAKQMLHTDEEPYFVCGNKQTFINMQGKKIGLGICYETLQRAHFINAKDQGADIYMASVAKSQSGIEKAYAHFPKIASEFTIPILMSNCVGFCDNFLSVGQSAAWNNNGELAGQLDHKNQGLLIYDTELNTAASYSLEMIAKP
jgi:predicted amidohydrolase